MIKKLKAKADVARARGAGGARLDLLLPQGWPQTEATIAWRWRSPVDETRTGEGTLESPPLPGPSPVYVWTPATETLLTQTRLPTTSRAKLAQALPYALEEQLLDDPANLHFAWRREEDGVLSVAVTAKEHVRTWLATLQRAGLKPAALCPATLLVPWSPDCWSAAYIGDELLVRTGPTDGFTCPATYDEPPALLAATLRQKREAERAPDYLIVFKPPPAFSVDAWSTALGVPVRVEEKSFWDIAGDSEPALNLLQGEFAPTGEMGKQLRRWIPAAVMLALWLVGTIAFDLTEWWRLRRQHETNTREMTALLMSTFPDTKTVLDPFQQMQRNIETLQTRSGAHAHDLLPLLARATPAWRAEPGARLRGMRYADRSLTFELSSPDAQALERFRQALQAGGLQAETLATTTRAGEVEGRVRVRPPAAASSTKP